MFDRLYRWFRRRMCSRHMQFDQPSELLDNPTRAVDNEREVVNVAGPYPPNCNVSDFSFLTDDSLGFITDGDMEKGPQDYMTRSPLAWKGTVATPSLETMAKQRQTEGGDYEPERHPHTFYRVSCMYPRHTGMTAKHRAARNIFREDQRPLRSEPFDMERPTGAFFEGRDPLFSNIRLPSLQQANQQIYPSRLTSEQNFTTSYDVEWPLQSLTFDDEPGFNPFYDDESDAVTELRNILKSESRTFNCQRICSDMDEKPALGHPNTAPPVPLLPGPTFTQWCELLNDEHDSESPEAIAYARRPHDVMPGMTLECRFGEPRERVRHGGFSNSHVRFRTRDDH
jgi:hypothetical protein